MCGVRKPRYLADDDRGTGRSIDEPHITVAAYGGAGGSHMPIHYGLGGKEIGVAINDERFFRTINHGIPEQHARPADLPLVLKLGRQVVSIPTERMQTAVCVAVIYPY